MNPTPPPEANEAIWANPIVLAAAMVVLIIIMAMFGVERIQKAIPPLAEWVSKRELRALERKAEEEAKIRLINDARVSMFKDQLVHVTTSLTEANETIRQQGEMISELKSALAEALSEIRNLRGDLRVESTSQPHGAEGI